MKRKIKYKYRLEALNKSIDGMQHQSLNNVVGDTAAGV